MLPQKKIEKILQSLLPEAILTTYEAQNLELEIIEEAISWADVIDIGPGLGKSETAQKILKLVLEKRNCPLVIDADAINIMAKHQEFWKENMKEVIITPHLKEMSGICQKEIKEIKENLIETATKLASLHKLVCVLKDTRTIVADRDQLVYINQSGNNGMAKAGSGDVLSGIITGLLAQHMEIFEGAALGVYIHGLSGDEAAQKMGQYSILARDIAESISSVI